MANINKMTKAALQDELATLGERAPTRWTKLELKARIQELRGDQEEVETTTGSILQDRTRALRKAAKKKSDLVKFCQDLGLMLNGNETMMVMECRALKKLQEECPGSPQDYVGFGKHSQLQYIDILRDYEGYATWVKQMFKDDPEGTSTDPRLRRLAKWLMEADEELVIPKARKSVGRREEPMAPPRHTPGSSSSTLDRTGNQGEPALANIIAEQNKRMDQMADVIELLRNELTTSRGEPQRKGNDRKHDDGNLTDSSYSVVSTPAMKVSKVTAQGQEVQGSQHLAREDIRYLRQTGLMLPPKGPPMDVHFAAKPAETPEPQEGLQGEGQEEQALAGEAVQGLKLLMTKICEADPSTPPEEALSQAPDATGRFLPHEGQIPEELLMTQPQATFEQEDSATVQVPTRGLGVLLEDPGGNSYQDLTQEVPSEQEWARAQDPQQEDPEEWDEDGPEPSQPSVIRRTASYVGPKVQETKGSHWWESVPESAWSAEECSFWADSQQAVEVEIPLPESRRGQEHMLKNMEGFFVSALKRRAVEVCERKLSEEDKAKFREAKATEVRNFISAKAFEALPANKQPDRSQAVGMRWILTWKVKDDGGVKAKARAVLLGIKTPATNTDPQQPLLCREYPDDMFCIPCPEICESMGLPEGSVTKLKRACYGLVDAPLEWYKTIAEYLQDIGLTRLWSDSCAWVWRPGGPGTAVRGMITGHVDDFLFGGSVEDQGWTRILELIKNRFKWGDWDQGSFVQCGVQVDTIPEGFALSQPRYLDTVDEIPVSTQRRKGLQDTTTPQVSQSTVQSLIKANQLLSVERNKKGHKLLIQRCDNAKMQFYAWVNAASQNRVDGSSTQGIFIGAASDKLLKGELDTVSPISWHSQRIERKCRSPGAAETQAAVNGEDALFYARFQWAEIVHGNVNLRYPAETVRRVGGCLITDSRNVYDKLQTEMLVIKGAEKRHGGNAEMDLFYRMKFVWRIVEDPEMKSARRRKGEGLQPLQQQQKEICDENVDEDYS
ncbi:RE1 [Symbiodinium sp. KB8]|nr:RE1 [Symbiodinium sp. KB8]